MTLLKLKHICKDYSAGDSKVHALKDVSINFRESEFVSVLGPSGCGKTTLLNIIGGLDGYTSGDLIVEDVSTKEYTSSDWDVYRNHKIGFVFQNYNLIPHQSVLSNVELALTLSGVSKKERRTRAIDALNKVGLGDQLDKRPNQMSGGQMQRVAIARALVNNPDILLADEPTGALDSETSVQIMEILKEISKNKLIIMVTHNPELAEKYSTRIIRFLDGTVISDSDEYILQDETPKAEITVKKEKGRSMSFFTALSLSFNNLLTKKARTLLTSFAGSIGIIGIALILAVSSGVQIYINDVQEDTLSSYPIIIEAESIDATELMKNIMGVKEKKKEHKRDKVYSNSALYDMLNAYSTAGKDYNNLSKFKEYIESDKNNFGDDLTAVQYGYDLPLNIYTKNIDGDIVKSDINELMQELYGMSNEEIENSVSQLSNSAFSSFSTMQVWEELLPGMDGEVCNGILSEQYDVIYGRWPEKYNEIILIVDENNEISDLCLYALGLTSTEDMKSIMNAFMKGEEIKSETQSWSYKEICDMSFKLVLSSDFYQYDSATETYKDISLDETGMDYLYNNGIDLKVTGIIRPNDDAASSMMSGSIGYTSLLTEYAISKSNENDIIKKQLENKDVDVLSGLPFKTDEDEKISDKKKANEFKKYAEGLGVTEKASLYVKIASVPEDSYVDSQVESVLKDKSRDEIMLMMESLASESQTEISPETLKEYMSGLSDEEFNKYITEMFSQNIREQYAKQVETQLSSMSNDQLSAMLDTQLPTYSVEQLAQFYDSYMPATVSESTLDDNLKKLGYVDIDNPSKISLFSSTFASKDAVAEEITNYNKTVDKSDEINYTDYVALLMSSITTIINAISYVLIAFVAISLIVSSIMIGIITYISVLERTKEIGILRSIGASKKDVSRVFNAETMIIGFVSGVIGIAVSCGFIFIINIILHKPTGIANLNAVLPVAAAVILIAISMILTLIAGLIPSGIAAKKDPVEALRTE